MPVSKHRRHSKPRPRKPNAAPTAPRLEIRTIDDLRREVSNPALGFPERIGITSLWWCEQLSSKVGDHRRSDKVSRKDRQTAAMLLCVAMDGEQGQNDNLAPDLAAILRPWCAAATFTEAWEQAKHLPSGTVRMRAARFLESLQAGSGTEIQPPS
jgi:hypothetical protein